MPSRYDLFSSQCFKSGLLNLNKQSLLHLPKNYTAAQFAGFQSSVESILDTFANVSKLSRRPTELDADYLAILAGLPSDADSEDLEDWIHCTCDAMSINGTVVPSDELDMDQVRSGVCGGARRGS